MHPQFFNVNILICYKYIRIENCFKDSKLADLVFWIIFWSKLAAILDFANFANKTAI